MDGINFVYKRKHLIIIWTTIIVNSSSNLYQILSCFSIFAHFFFYFLLTSILTVNLIFSDIFTKQNLFIYCNIAKKKSKIFIFIPKFLYFLFFSKKKAYINRYNLSYTTFAYFFLFFFFLSQTYPKKWQKDKFPQLILWLEKNLKDQSKQNLKAINWSLNNW